MFERKAFVWEVSLLGEDKKTYVEKVKSYWSPSFPGVKDSIAIAARGAAMIRNKGKEFGIVSAPTLLGREGDEGVTA